MTAAETVLVPLVVVGVGVLAWAVASRLLGASRWIREVYAPRPWHATFDPEPIPEGWLQIVPLGCDGDCACRMPHECDGVLALCIECGARRIVPTGVA